MRRGFSIIELTIALALLTASFVSLSLLVTSIPAAIHDGVAEGDAMRVADSQLESALMRGSRSYASVPSIATTTQDGISRSLHSIPQDDGVSTFLISTVSWSDAHHKVRYGTRTGILANVTRTADPHWCNSLSHGDWMHLWSTAFTAVSGSLLPLGAVPFPISSLAVSSSTLLMLASTTAHKSDPDLLVFDIGSTTNPQYLGSVDTATSTKTGISSAVIVGSTAYVASAVSASYTTCKQSSSCAQLEVVSLATTSLPTVRSAFQLATASPPYAVGAGGQSIGKAIAYAHGFLYLGLSKTATTTGQEFNVIDVVNAVSPRWLGGFHIGRTINAIAIKGAYAYLATDDPQQELVVLDVRDPTHIKMVTTYDAPGNALYGYSEDIAFASSTIVLGRTYAPGSSELMFLSTSATGTLTLSGSTLAASSSNPVSVEGLITDPLRVAVLTNEDLELWDIHATDLMTTSLSSTPYPRQLGVSLTSVVCRNETLYVGSVASTGVSSLTVMTHS